MLFYDLGENGNGWYKISFARFKMKSDVFFCCPGPSLKDAKLERGRGRIIYAINTAYPAINPDVWLGLDRLECYDKNIWAEPFIKICRGNYHDMELDGAPIKHFDNVYFANLEEPEEGKTMLDYREHNAPLVWHKNTMAAGLHLAIKNGARNIHLVGCDMGGNTDYHDDRKLTKDQRIYNRALYKNQIQFIKTLARKAKQQGINFISCTPKSPLNKFLPYKELSIAIKESEKKVEISSNTPVLHCIDAEKLHNKPKSKYTKPVIMHCNNYAGLGGMETTIIDISKEMPEYSHVICSVNQQNADQNFIEYLKKIGIDHYFGPLKSVAEQINPEYVFLHNTHQFKNELIKYKTIAAHHGHIAPFTPANLHDWFVSDWVKNSYGEYIGKNHTILPPPVWADDYINIKRPERTTPVIGRIQSGTWAHRGKTTQEFYDTLEKIKGCGYFIVGKDIPGQFPSKPILPGKMPEYLQEIDIFAIWGNTTETWSKVVTEANLAGIPVIARNHHDGLAEQLNKSKGGILVDTIDEFQKTLQDLVNDKEKRESIGQTGKKWCIKNATTKTFKNWFEKIIND